MPSKLRRLTTAKGLTPAELELINRNWDDIEYALNSVGAATPGGGTASGSFDLSILNDYLYLPGRTGGQIVYGGNSTGDYLLLKGNSVDIDGFGWNTSEIRFNDHSMAIRSEGGVATSPEWASPDFILMPSDITGSTSGRFRFQHHTSGLTRLDLIPGLTGDHFGLDVNKSLSIRALTGELNINAKNGTVFTTSTGTWLVQFGQGVVYSTVKGDGSLYLSSGSTPPATGWSANVPRLYIHNSYYFESMDSKFHTKPLIQLSRGTDLYTTSYYHEPIFEIWNGARTFRLFEITDNGGIEFNNYGAVEDNTVFLKLTPNATHSVNLQEWYNTSGILANYIDKDGLIHGDGSGLTGIGSGLDATANESITGQWDFDAQTDFDAQLRINPSRAIAAGTVPIDIRTTAATTSNILELYGYTNALDIKIDKYGIPYFLGADLSGRSVVLGDGLSSIPTFSIQSGSSAYVFGQIEDKTTGAFTYLALNGIPTYATITLPATGGSVITTVSIDTLLNKTLSNSTKIRTGNTFTGAMFQDVTDNTKQAYFDCGVNFSTGNTAKLLLPFRNNNTLVSSIPPYIQLNQTGNLGSSGSPITLFTTPASYPGKWKVIIVIKCAVAGSGGCTLDGSLRWTDYTGSYDQYIVPGVSMDTVDPAVSGTGDGTTGYFVFEQVIYANTSTAIQFFTTLNIVSGSPAYDVLISCIALD